MAEPEVVTSLTALGFSLNASRAYHALLRESPATGYEVGARAKIPRSAVYGVLRNLVAEGLARSVAGTPERFAAVPADHVLALLKKRFEQSTTKFQDAVSRIDVVPTAPDAYSVRGYGRILEEAERLVAGAESRLILSGWPREAAKLAPEIRRAFKRGAFLVMFSHSSLPKLPGHVFSYGLREEDLEAFWKHRLIVVADDKRTLIASTENTEHDHGVLSETVPVAEVATSQIALDITLLSQRTHLDVRKVMEKMLGDRVGRLDSLMAPAE